MGVLEGPGLGLRDVRGLEHRLRLLHLGEVGLGERRAPIESAGVLCLGGQVRRQELLRGKDLEISSDVYFFLYMFKNLTAKTHSNKLDFITSKKKKKKKKKVPALIPLL